MKAPLLTLNDGIYAPPWASVPIRSAVAKD